MTSTIGNEEDLSEKAGGNSDNCLQVVHQIPGRIRLRATDINSNSSFLAAIAKQLRQQQGIEKVEINLETRSLTVNFDPKQRSLPQIIELLEQLNIIAPRVLPDVAKLEGLAALQSVDFWQEQGRSFLPLVTGLLVTGRLGLHGLPAIPAYLITASITRHLLEYFGSEQNLTEKNQPQITQKVQESTVSDMSGQATSAYKIVHAIPGRTRFHVPKIAQDQTYAQRLQQLLQADPQFTSFRINPAAATVVVTYQPSLTAQVYQRWHELMQLAGAAGKQEEDNKNSPAAVDFSQHHFTQLELETVNGQHTTAKVANPWAEFKRPVLAASLDYMANLPI